MRRTAEEWGRVAVSLPGWRWMPGMQTLPLPTPGLPDPDDPATAGCLLALLGPGEPSRSLSLFVRRNGFEVDFWAGPALIYRTPGPYSSAGRACIAAAEQLGRWPGARLPIPAGLGGNDSPSAIEKWKSAIKKWENR